MRWTLLLLTALLAWTPASAHAQEQDTSPVSEEDQEAFDQMFEDRLHDASRSRSTDDDLELAQDMMDFATRIGDDHGVRCLIYIEVIQLSANAGDLYMMTTAGRLLEQLWPGNEPGSGQRLLNLADHAYRVGDREEREDMADAFIDLLLTQALVAEEIEDYTEAVSLCRQAASVARQVETDREELIEMHLDRVEYMNGLVNRIEMLTLSVTRNPQSRPAAQELVTLLVVKRDDPITAMEYVELTVDAELIEQVTLAALGPTQATPPEALMMGDWYRGLAEDERDNPAIAEPLLERARAFYGRFLTEYGRRDTLAAHVRQMELAVSEWLDEIAQARREANDTGWTNLFEEHFDPERNAFGEDLVFEDGQISFNRGRVTFPISPAGSYELRIGVTINQVDDDRAAMMVYIPVGPWEAAVVRYVPTSMRPAWIDGQDRDSITPTPGNRMNREIEVLIQVAYRGENMADIAVILDGQEVMRWSGDANDLWTNEDFRPPEELGRVFLLTCPSQLTIHSVELREHD